jgi:hypothetical protein
MSNKIKIYTGSFFASLIFVIGMLSFKLNMYDLYSSNCNKDVSISLFKEKLFSNLPFLTESITSAQMIYMVKDLNKIFINKKNMIIFSNQVHGAVTLFENKSSIEFNYKTILSNLSNAPCSYKFLIKKNLETSNFIIANNLKKYVFFILLSKENNMNNKNKVSYSEIKFYQEYLVVKNNSKKTEIIFFSDFIKRESTTKLLYLILKRDYLLFINVILLFNFLIFYLYKIMSLKK